MTKRLNSTAKLSFYNARARKGDVVRIADETGYSESHVRQVKNGQRSINEMLGNAFYNISRRRIKNSERAY